MESRSLVDHIDRAITAHAQWRTRLTTAIRTGQTYMPADDIACDDKCAFGKWLYGPEFDSVTKAGKPYQVTRRLHAEFHEVAGKVAALAEKGQNGEAYMLLDREFVASSDILTRALKKWRGEVSR